MSDDFVIDASALMLALVGRTLDAERLRERLRDIRLHAPHLIDAEIGNVLRRHERRGLVGTEEAETAMASGRALVRHRYPHYGRLAELAWALRPNLTFYDALYVALAGRLGVPLITADRRLTRVPGLPCATEEV